MVFENEPSESDVMQRPPRDAQAPLFAGLTLALALLQGLGALLLVMAAYAWSSSWLAESAARAFAFTTLVLGNLALILSNRSRSGSLWASLAVPNRTLWIVTAVTLGLLGLVLYQSWLARLFFFAPLSAPDFLTAAALGLSSLIWFEAIKLSRRLFQGSAAIPA
jgi:Ca2+-transporting ATPase